MASWLLLLNALLIYITGFSAGETVYVETGASVHLNIQREKLPAKYDDISWKNKDSDNLVKYIVLSKEVRPHPDYKNRVDFNTETFSLTLKNMQKNDTGIYRAIASGLSDKVLAEHRVYVIDAVNAPVLTVNLNWSSTEPSELCNLTCTADNIIIDSSVYNSSCSEEVKSSGYNNVNLKCTDDIIICNYSNPVSWKNHTQTVQQLCSYNPEKKTLGPGFVHLYWLIPITCILLGLIVAIGLHFYKNKKVYLMSSHEHENTIYAEVEENKTKNSLEMIGSKNTSAEKEPDVTVDTSQTTPEPQSINQKSPAVKSKTDNGVTVYSTVKRHPIPPTSESEKTIYAVVNKHPAGYESVY